MWKFWIENDSVVTLCGSTVCLGPNESIQEAS